MGRERCWSSRATQTLVVVLTVASGLVSGAEGQLIETPLTLLHEVPFDSREPQRVAGYFELNSTRAGRMFYWFFESRAMRPTDPLVLWIPGGPGCSSARTVFLETGPFRLDADLTVRLADWSWDLNHNIIYVDQPIGTGFSYSTDDADTVYDQAQLSEDMMSFLEEFLNEHPDMVSGGQRDFYLAGLSYAGHMVPNIAAAIRLASLPLRFAGVALGNPWVNPGIQYRSFGEYGVSAGILTEQQRADIDNRGVPLCMSIIDNCLASGNPVYCSRGVNLCATNTVGAVLDANPGMNVYDVRRPCVGELCYDYTTLTSFLGQEEVKEKLGVDVRWNGPCAMDTHAALMGDWLLPYDHLIEQLLEEGMPVLIYAGKEDLLCNWVGQQMWLEALTWEGGEAFRAAPYKRWLVNGQVAGSIRSAGLLTFVIIEGAGHEVAMDTPQELWALFSRFTRNVTLADDRDDAAWLPRGSDGQWPDGEEANRAVQPSGQHGGPPEVSVEGSLVKEEKGGGWPEGDAVVDGSIGLAGRRR